MKFSNYLIISKIEIGIAVICIIFTLAWVILTIASVIKPVGKQIFILPVVEGIGCLLFIIAMITELIRYYKNNI